MFLNEIFKKKSNLLHFPTFPEGGQQGGYDIHHLNPLVLYIFEK